MKEEHVITVRRNGTTYIVVLKAVEGTRIAFEELMKKKIIERAITLKTEKNS